MKQEEKKRHPYFMALKEKEMKEKYGDSFNEMQRKLEDMIVESMLRTLDVHIEVEEIPLPLGLDSVIWFAEYNLDYLIASLNDPRERAYMIARLVKEKLGLDVHLTKEIEHES